MIILLVAGLLAGIVNTLAGGGSMLSLPALMMLGMPADIANATNRVGIFLQSIAGAKGFWDYDRLDSSAIGPILVPTLAGALIGSVAASYLPVWLLKPTLLCSMVLMALVMLVRPGTISPADGTPVRKLNETPLAIVSLFFAGMYGGFVQAGVGFILIAALAGGLRYDLVRTNALKMVCTAVLSGVALIVFVARDQVMWFPGLVLAVGMVIGATLSVRFAISVSQKTLKWLLLIMVSIASGAAMLS